MKGAPTTPTSLRMRVRPGQPSPAAAQRWDRRADTLATLLAEMWAMEHASPSPTTDLSTASALTPPSIEPLLLTTNSNASIDRTDATP